MARSGNSVLSIFNMIVCLAHEPPPDGSFIALPSGKDVLPAGASR